MNYNEWRDELKNNLLCVSESERRRVLDYYAEAYADRREAGFSEREIIDDFGAPYDAAQRILSENKNDECYGEAPAEEMTRREKRREMRERRREEQQNRERQNNGQYDNQPYNGQQYGGQQNNYYAPPPPLPVYANNAPAAAKTDNTWLFVLLCIIFAGPIFGLIMAMVGITIGFCVAPVAVVAAGCGFTVGAIGAFAGGSVAYGFSLLGTGIIILGVGIILCPVFFKLVKLMWKLFKQFFTWLKSLFGTKGGI